VNICHRIDSSYSTGLAAAAQTRVRLRRMTVLDWLLDSDPAIRWQGLRCDRLAEVLVNQREPAVGHQDRAIYVLPTAREAPKLRIAVTSLSNTSKTVYSFVICNRPSTLFVRFSNFS
jgi:hypothetical protein